MCSLHGRIQRRTAHKAPSEQAGLGKGGEAENMNIEAGIALFFAGLSLGMSIVNTIYSILREKGQHSKYGSNNSSNR